MFWIGYCVKIYTYKISQKAISKYIYIYHPKSREENWNLVKTQKEAACIYHLRVEPYNHHQKKYSKKEIEWNRYNVMLQSNI